MSNDPIRPDAELPPHGTAARVSVNAVAHVLAPDLSHPGGVFVSRPGRLILSVPGQGGVRLDFTTPDDAARLALALLTVASAMEGDQHRAAAEAAEALDRIAQHHEAGHA